MQGRDAHLLFALDLLGDGIHHLERRVVLDLGEHTVASVGGIEVRVRAEVDEELRVAAIRNVPVGDRSRATRVGHLDARARLIDLEVAVRVLDRRAVQAALDHEVGPIEGLAVVNAI